MTTKYDYTSVMVNKKFVKILKILGKKGESYQDIIIRLMKENNPSKYRSWRRFNAKWNREHGRI